MQIYLCISCKNYFLFAQSKIKQYLCSRKSTLEGSVSHYRVGLQT